MPHVPPEAQLSRMITGYWTSQAIYAAAKFGIADLLNQGAKSVQEIAAATSTKPELLYRLMRALASVGIFAEEDGKCFSLTPLDTAGFALTRIVPTSTEVSVIEGTLR